MARDWQGRYRSRLLNLVERAVHKARHLRWKAGEAVTGQVKGKVPDTFLIDRSSLLEPYI